MSNENGFVLPSSALAEHAVDGVSKRYTFVSTTQLIEALRGEGWEPHSGNQVKTRNPLRQGYQKHLIRFRQMDPDNQIIIGGSVAELLAINSHDRSSPYEFRSGLYRFACANGLVTSNGEFDRFKVRHSGSLAEIMEASMKVANNLKRLEPLVTSLEKTTLTDAMELEFAQKALDLRFGEFKPIKPSDLLMVRREDDREKNLWTTFNVVQENLTQGGMVGVSRTTGRDRKVTSVRGMNRQIGINAQLWDLALSFAA